MTTDVLLTSIQMNEQKMATGLLPKDASSHLPDVHLYGTEAGKHAEMDVGANVATWVYLLQCANGKLYVGKTTHLHKRMDEHCLAHGATSGAAWTRLHAPESLLRVTVESETDTEDIWILQLLRKYGDIEKVRGGTFSEPVLPDYKRQVLTDMLRTNADTCYRCNKPGHFVADCQAAPPASQINNRGKRRHQTSNRLQPASLTVMTPDEVARIPNILKRYKYQGCLGRCFRCGNTSHISTECFAQVAIDGETLT